MNIPPEVEETRARIAEDGVILCVRMSEKAPVVDACIAASRGGLKIFEITMTTPGALESMVRLSREEGVLVGAGTVLDPGMIGPIADAGGRFALSPVFDPAVVDEAHRHGLLAMPGASTPGEMLAAWRHGATLVKVFPARALGGPGFLRSVRGPLPDIPLVPTSGPDSGNIAEYVGAGAVAVGVGSEVFPPGFTLDGVEAAARRVRSAMDRARTNADQRRKGSS